VFTNCKKSSQLGGLLPKYKTEKRGEKYGIWSSWDNFKHRHLSAQFEYDKVSFPYKSFPIMENDNQKYVLIDRQIFGPFRDVSIHFVQKTESYTKYSDWYEGGKKRKRKTFNGTRIFAQIDDSSSMLINPFYGSGSGEPIVSEYKIPYVYIEMFNGLADYFLAKDQQGKTGVLFNGWGVGISIMPFKNYESITMHTHNKNPYLICLSNNQEQRFWLQAPQKIGENQIFPLKTDLKIVYWLKSGNYIVQNKDNNKIGLIGWKGEILAPNIYERFEELDNGDCLLINPGKLKIKKFNEY